MGIASRISDPRYRLNEQVGVRGTTERTTVAESGNVANDLIAAPCVLWCYADVARQ
jgi:hypothetical protein